MITAPPNVENMHAMRRAGDADSAIAAAHGVTRQRVHQLLGPRPPRRRQPRLPLPPPVDFGRALREWRARRGLSQSQAARLLRVTAHSVSCWETGRTGCSLAATVLRLLELLP